MCSAALQVMFTWKQPSQSGLSTVAKGLDGQQYPCPAQEGVPLKATFVFQKKVKAEKVFE